MDNNTLLSEILCTGCMACVTKCPQNCIKIKKNDYGFFFPDVNSNKCINCKLCISSCPSRMTELKGKISLKSYVAFLRDEKKYINSASGGAFYGFAQYVLKKNGVVFGATYDSNESIVRHIMISNEEDIKLLQGSKYVQSYMGNIYQNVINELEDGKLVLFSGTPCQVAGLYSIIDSKYEHNLITVEVICHGVSNNDFLLKSIESYTGSKKNINDIRFRNKSKYEKSEFSLCIEYSDRKVVKIPAQNDLYYRMYVDGLIYRESCYECLYATNKRIADITIGDCSTYKDYNYLNPNKALSTVIINTANGNKLWNNCQELFVFDKQDMEKEFRSNAQLSHPVKKPAELKNIYDNYINKSIRVLRKKYVRINYKETIIRIIKNCISLKSRNRIKRLMHKA